MATIDLKYFNRRIVPSAIREVSQAEDGSFSITSYYPTTVELSEQRNIVVLFNETDYEELLKYRFDQFVLCMPVAEQQDSLILAHASVFSKPFSSGTKMEYVGETYSFRERSSYTEEIIDEGYAGAGTYPYLSYYAEEALENGLLLSGSATFSTSLSAEQKPYCAIRYFSPYEIRTMSPSDGSALDKRTDILFSWALNNASVEALLYTFYWREKGSDVVNSVNCGTNTFVTIPSNTFTGDEIEWMVDGYTSDLMPISWNWTWFSLTVTVPDAVPAAIAVSPNNTVIDRANITELKWEHVVATGTAQTKAVIESSADGASFTELAVISGSSNTYFIPANTLNSGNFYWRVKTYNSEGVEGSWSNIAHVIVFGSPEAPGVSLREISPRPVVGWSSPTQVAYSIQFLDAAGRIVHQKSVYGFASTYQCPVYLNDGAYIVRLRVQNQFGLWSPWAEGGFTVANVSVDEISLSAAANINVALFWTSSGSHAKYLVYRDGKLIGETTATSFTDHFAIGDATYYVRGIYDTGDNYTESNTTHVTVSVKSLMIASVNDTQWLALPLSTSSLRSTSLNASHSVTYTHYVGIALPGAEIGEAVDQTYQLDCAWPVSKMEQAKAFEQLAGKLVCVKMPSGRRIVGVMGSWTSEENRFWISYSAPITLIHWEEGTQ